MCFERYWLTGEQLDNNVPKQLLIMLGELQLN